MGKPVQGEEYIQLSAKEKCERIWEKILKNPTEVHSEEKGDFHNTESQCDALVAKVVWSSTEVRCLLEFLKWAKHAYIVFRQGTVSLKVLIDGRYSLNLTYTAGQENEELYELAK